MSINLLEHLGLSVDTADELEAFLHVLLYNAVRFLIHNLDPIVPFVQKYFDGQDEVEGRFFSPETKSNCIRIYGRPQHYRKHIVFSRPDGTGHTINLIFRDLFHLIQGRYAVLDYKATKADLEKEIQVEIALQKKAEQVRRAQQSSSRHNRTIRPRMPGVRVAPAPTDSVVGMNPSRAELALAELN